MRAPLVREKRKHCNKVTQLLVCSPVRPRQAECKGGDGEALTPSQLCMHARSLARTHARVHNTPYKKERKKHQQHRICDYFFGYSVQLHKAHIHMEYLYTQIMHGHNHTKMHGHTSACMTYSHTSKVLREQLVPDGGEEEHKDDPQEGGQQQAAAVAAHCPPQSPPTAAEQTLTTGWPGDFPHICFAILGSKRQKKT